MIDNPITVNAEVENVKCQCGRTIEDESDYYDAFGFPMCLRCGKIDGWKEKNDD